MMLLSNVKVLTIIATLCNARFLDRPSGVASTTLPYDTLISRQDVDYCKADCTPTKCGGTSCTISRRHTLEHTYGSSNTTEYVQLYKRTLSELRQRDIGNYISERTFLPTVHNICPKDPNVGGGYVGPSFCVQQAFSSATLDEGQLLIGTGNTELEGCTVLTVVSARAVYMCHFWQDLHYRFSETSSREFHGFQAVINLITGSGPTPWAVGPALNPDLFTHPDDRTWAFIMTPRSEARPQDATTQIFGEEYNILVNTLRGLIPGISVSSYNYDWRLEDRRVKPWRGTALFEYDKDSDGKGKPNWRLFYERSSNTGSLLGQNVD